MANATYVTMETFSASIARITELETQLIKATEAQQGQTEALDNIWMLYSASLIFFMNPGFAFLEAGSVRFKNTQHILAKNLIVPVVCFLVWYLFGYGLAFGTTADPGKFAGSKIYFVMKGFWAEKVHFRKWFFQGCFCETAATIVSGCTAERTSFWAFVLYTCMVTGFVYPIAVHWAWSGTGWLNFKETGDGVPKSLVGAAYMDFAGSGVIHLLGGVGGLVGAIVVGPRKGRFDPALQDEFLPHSINFCVLGTFILWFGWYGFNPGSTLAMSTAANAYQSALVACNTSLSPCTAGLVVFLIRYFMTRKLDIGGLCNGILAGLVAITAGCAFVQAWEAIIIGFISALIYQGCSMLLHRLRIDDPVDAVSVHAANGLWAIIACGLFGDPAEGIGGNGVFYKGGNQLGVQVVAGIVIILWSAGCSIAIFVPLRLLGLLRVPDDFQDKGADEVQHSPTKSYITNEGTNTSEHARAQARA